jgi:hypothetical protein
MSKKEETPHTRAEELRKRIAEVNAPPDPGAAEDHPEMLPGESPNEYVERRMRELRDKKSGGGPPGHSG